MAIKKTFTIAVNQCGYRPGDRKIAVFPAKIGRFSVKDVAAGTVVWSGDIKNSIEDEAAGGAFGTGDFTALSSPGMYRLETADGDASFPFSISENPYKELHKALLKAFYYFRCGMELEEHFAGPWSHKACHLEPGIVYGQEHRRLDACGGWHDAGDYGKYSGPGAKAVADLMLAFEWYPDTFASTVPLPESDGRTPDVLHECRYELEWLLKMQDPITNGVFHKLSTKRFPGYILPEDDLDELYVSPISAAATGCFAGVLAAAARVYRPFDASFADTCLQAAFRAWEWMERNPQVPGFRNPVDIVTGEYGDEYDRDERFWAAAELYRTTGEEHFRSALVELASNPSFDFYRFGWADMGGYGTIAYLFSGRDGAEDPLYAKLLEGLTAQAKKLVERSADNAFVISLRPEDYIWGSNMDVMHNAMLLLAAYRLTGDDIWEKYALEHMHYVLGRNVLNMSYVTGFGANSVMQPHHRPSIADTVSDPVPGLVSGGPNRGLQDPCAREHFSGRPPAACFIDDKDSYSTNEVTIYWNSPALFVVSHFISAAGMEKE